MQLVAYYHGGFLDYVIDMVVRSLVYRTVAIGTRGWGFMPILLVTLAVVGLAWIWNRRRA